MPAETRLDFVHPLPSTRTRYKLLGAALTAQDAANDEMERAED